jgi:hypothetical protein
MTTNEQRRTLAVAEAVQVLGRAGEDPAEALNRLWDAAFEAGRLAALDELQDRFCVCMK